MESNTNRKLLQSQPQRQCVSCRQTSHKASLLRFVLMGDVAVFDLRSKAMGRSFYLCAKKSCIEKAWKRKRISDLEGVLQSVDLWVEKFLLFSLERRSQECIVNGFRSGVLISGADAVEELSKRDELAGYCLANDISEGSRLKYERNAARKELRVLGRYDREFFSRLSGKANTTVMGWKRSKIYDEYLSTEIKIMNIKSEFSLENSVNIK